MTDAAGRVIRFTFDQQHRCTAFLLPDGRRATFAYDPAGLLSHTEDLMGIPVDYEYDGENTLIKMVTGKSRRTVSFSYRSAGKEKLLASFSDPNGNVTHYNLLPGSPRSVEATDPEGNKTIFQSRAGLTTKVVNGLGQEASFKYAGGLPVGYRDRNGGLTRWEYDSAGRRSKEIDPTGQAVTFSYDLSGNLLKITDPLGGSWHYRYNEQNSLLEICSPAGRKIALDYDDRGLPVSITAFDGQKITHEYDRYGNVVAAHHSGGGSSFSAYDEYGYRIISTTDQLGYTAYLEQDGNGRLIKFRHPDGAEKTLIHDCCHALLATDERGVSRGYERDANGNIIKEIDAAAATAEHGYNGNNNLISYRDFAGETTYYHYDGARRLVSITNALGQHQQFGYDAAGNMTNLWVAGEEKMRFHYDPCHRLIATTDPLGATVTIDRDALGREVVRRGARGQEISFVHNADGLLEKVLHDGQEVGSYRYSSGDQMVEARDGLGQITFDYDEKGLPRRISYPDGWELLGAGNAAGLLESITYPGGFTVRYRYNSRLRPVEINWEGGGIKYEYDPAGNLLREERSNGTVSRYRYDENERLVFLEHARGEEVLIERRNKLNAAGAITEATGFQPLEPPADHDFDLFCNSADQISAPSFAYDGDGNLVKGPGWEAAYDEENRLVEFKIGDHGTSYRYNSLGQRVEKEADGRIHRYYHDGLGHLMFETAAGEIEPRCYLYCHNRPVAVIDEKKQVRFYHYDQNGNTLALTGGDGAVLAAYAYSPFGCSLAVGDPGGNPFTFCGAYGVTEEAAGLYAMGRRFYTATWGRFLQKDPLGFEGGVNSYVYAANNPISYLDAEGTAPIAIWGAFKVASLAVGVVTTTYYACKTAYCSYKTGSGVKKEYSAIQKVQKACSDYHEVLKSHGTEGGWDEKERAFRKWQIAYRELVVLSNETYNNKDHATDAAVETLKSAATPKVLNIPVTIYNREQLAKEAKWLSGAGKGPCRETIQHECYRKPVRLHY